MKKGKFLIYVGEYEGGCCANDYFFDILYDDFEEVEVVKLLNFTGIRNHLFVYRKK